MKTSFSELRQHEKILTGQRHVLQLVAKGTPLAAVLEALVHVIEPQVRGMLCSILLLDEDGIHLRHGAAPSLPDAYNRALDGAIIGPTAGSCGTSAYLGTSVIVSDVFHDFRWKEYLFLTKLFNFRACWSTPIISSMGKVLGTFAMYYRKVRSPTDFELNLIRDTTALAAIAIERARADAHLKRILLQEHEARIEAEKSVQMRDDFIAIASHELRTPITPLKMQLQLIRRYLRDTQATFPKQELLLQALGYSDRELDRLVKLIEDLIDVSKITAGRLMMHAKNVNFSNSIRETAHRLEAEARVAHCTVIIRIEEGVFAFVDQFRLEQVITNLLLNAFKYGANRPVEISLSVQKKFAVLSVRDYGIGIAKEDQSKLFRRFERLAPIKHFAGLGLGLYIVRQIVEASGGRIRVESALGQGSTFIVELPLARTP